MDPTYSEAPGNVASNIGGVGGDPLATDDKREGSSSSSSGSATGSRGGDTWINSGWLQMAEDAKEALRKAAVDAGLPTPVKPGSRAANAAAGVTHGGTPPKTPAR